MKIYSNWIDISIFLTDDWLAGTSNHKKKGKVTGYEEVNTRKIVWEWFVSVRSRNLPISGPILQSYAKEIAEKLGKPNFTC